MKNVCSGFLCVYWLIYCDGFGASLPNEWQIARGTENQCKEWGGNITTQIQDASITQAQPVLTLLELVCRRMSELSVSQYTIDHLIVHCLKAVHWVKEFRKTFKVLLPHIKTEVGWCLLSRECLNHRAANEDMRFAVAEAILKKSVQATTQQDTRDTVTLHLLCFVGGSLIVERAYVHCLCYPIYNRTITWFSLCNIVKALGLAYQESTNKDTLVNALLHEAIEKKRQHTILCLALQAKRLEQRHKTRILEKIGELCF